MDECFCDFWGCRRQLDIFGIVLWYETGPVYMCFSCLCKFSHTLLPWGNPGRQLLNWEWLQNRKAELREILEREKEYKDKYWLKYI